MPMISFYSKFPALAVEETRTITVRGRDDLPDGEYGFLELYCDDQQCDCRRVLIHVLSPTSGMTVWATINFGWESLDFYEKWLHSKKDAIEIQGAALDPINPQTKYAPTLLQLFRFVLTDDVYVERLKRHYDLFKGVSQETEKVNKRRRKGTRKRKK